MSYCGAEPISENRLHANVLIEAALDQAIAKDTHTQQSQGHDGIAGLDGKRSSAAKMIFGCNGPTISGAYASRSAFCSFPRYHETNEPADEYNRRHSQQFESK